VQKLSKFIWRIPFPWLKIAYSIANKSRNASKIVRVVEAIWYHYGINGHSLPLTIPAGCLTEFNFNRQTLGRNLRLLEQAGLLTLESTKEKPGQRYTIIVMKTDFEMKHSFTDEWRIQKISLQWIQRVHTIEDEYHYGIKLIQVAHAVIFAWRTRRPLSNILCKEFGFTRWTKDDHLQILKKNNLITIEQEGKKSPIVTPKYWRKKQ
jgi:DNA-binding transcriptional ArsR family regulator